MPTYRNDTSFSILLKQGKAGLVKPGETQKVDFYGPPQLTLVAGDPPAKSPLLLVRTVEDGVIDDIPQAVRITVSIIASAPSTIYFADDPDGVPLSSGETFSISGDWAELAKIRVEGSARVAVIRED